MGASWTWKVLVHIKADRRGCHDEDSSKFVSKDLLVDQLLKRLSVRLAIDAEPHVIDDVGLEALIETWRFPHVTDPCPIPRDYHD